MDELMREIEAYAAACGLKPSTVVQNAGGGSGVAWARWKEGGSCSMRTADRIRAFMAENPAPSETGEDAGAARVAGEPSPEAAEAAPPAAGLVEPAAGVSERGAA